MTARLAYTLSAIFFLASGFLYTLERILAYYIWIGQMQAASITGQFPTLPELPSLFTNGFVTFFLAASVFLLIVGLILSADKQPLIQSDESSGPKHAGDSALPLTPGQVAGEQTANKQPGYLLYAIIAFLALFILVGILNFVR